MGWDGDGGGEGWKGERHGWADDERGEGMGGGWRELLLASLGERERKKIR